MITGEILLVEDTLSLAKLYTSYLMKVGYNITHCSTGIDAKNKLDKSNFDVVLLDLKLPDASGIEILRHIRDSEEDCSVIVITAHGTIDDALEATRLGAFDFLVKPFEKEKLIVTVQNAIENKRLSIIANAYSSSKIKDGYGSFIGSSPAMQAVYNKIERAASSRASVFITGESGTGKELCAKALHEQGGRSRGDFIAINCGAIPKDLIESEIFGHVKGAFTGASKDREGAASKAHKGTLFLDEICEMDMNLQTKFLRFIQTGTFRKVGSDKLEKVDVRFVCATNKFPLEEVTAGRFREDLYYRLHVVPIHLPPLKDREGDIITVANHYLSKFTKEEEKKFTSFSDDVKMIFRSYAWPGNIRQLQNIVRNIVVMNEGEKIETSMLPAPLDNITPHESISPIKVDDCFLDKEIASNDLQLSGPLDENDNNLILPMREVERRAIQNAINICNGDIKKAAEALKIGASSIYRKISEWKKEEGR
jgi:two-component system repressor protein LuxO